MDLKEKNIHGDMLLNLNDKEEKQEHCQMESTISISDAMVIWVVEFLREGCRIREIFGPK